ncbi:hypothetical protein [Flavobacterium sp.]|uniref:hypothetical protein n=1 Tax=Flavobacterium sp. TaxID=239 RepID=UPI0026057ABF|nr:hypothetical protein [Flavobacterium sp.]
MKKIILIVAIVLVAVVGLTSFNGKEVKKNENGDRLVASLTTAKTGTPVAGNKKTD